MEPKDFSGKDKLRALKELMKKNNVHAYVVPHDDAHFDEDINPSEERLAFISGFKGSNGVALISDLLPQALLWTDSRYYIQAKLELYEGWEMKKMVWGEKQWWDIIETFPEGTQVGYDPHLHPISYIETIETDCKKKKISLHPIDYNLIDQLWTDRPSDSSSPIFIHDVEFAGEEASMKLQRLGVELKVFANKIILTRLDEIACIHEMSIYLDTINMLY